MPKAATRKPAGRKPRRNDLEARVSKLERTVAVMGVGLGALEAVIRKMPEMVEREGVIVADKLLVAMSKRLEMHEHRVDRLVESRTVKAEGRLNLAIEEIRAARTDANDNAKAMIERLGEAVGQLSCPQVTCPVRPGGKT